MQDTDVVALFIARNEEALSLSRERYGRYLERIAMNVLGDRSDAEECLNSALYAAWNSIPPHHPEDLKTYLGKLTRRIAVSKWREDHAQKRRASAYAASLDEIAEIVADGDPDAEVSAQFLAERISSYLRTLPETERNVFIRRYWYGDSVAAIALRYGLGLSGVKMMLKRTRDKLAITLKEEGYL